MYSNIDGISGTSLKKRVHASSSRCGTRLSSLSQVKRLFGEQDGGMTDVFHVTRLQLGQYYFPRWPGQAYR